jgi:hypothetical protein
MMCQFCLNEHEYLLFSIHKQQVYPCQYDLKINYSCIKAQINKIEAHLLGLRNNNQA